MFTHRQPQRIQSYTPFNGSSWFNLAAYFVPFYELARLIEAWSNVKKNSRFKIKIIHKKAVVVVERSVYGFIFRLAKIQWHEKSIWLLPLMDAANQTKRSVR